MERKVSNVDIGEGSTRHRVVVLDDPSAPHTQAAQIRFYKFMRELADGPHLLQCGYSHPQRLLVTHNGTQWQAEAEADVTNLL